MTLNVQFWSAHHVSWTKLHPNHGDTDLNSIKVKKLETSNVLNRDTFYFFYFRSRSSILWIHTTLSCSAFQINDTSRITLTTLLKLTDEVITWHCQIFSIQWILIDTDRLTPPLFLYGLYYIIIRYRSPEPEIIMFQIIRASLGCRIHNVINSEG